MVDAFAKKTAAAPHPRGGVADRSNSMTSECPLFLAAKNNGVFIAWALARVATSVLLTPGFALSDAEARDTSPIRPCLTDVTLIALKGTCPSRITT